MITERIANQASHNPKEYQGIKFIPDYAGPATKEITDEILKYLDKDIETTECGKITKAPLENEYIKHLENIIDFSGKESKRTSFNTFEGRDYIMVINQNNNKKTEENSTNRKFNTNENENSINNISEKINKSFG